MRSRLDHLSTAYFTKDQKHMTKHQSHLHFEDLLSFIGQWVMVLTSKGNPQEGSTSRVAALGAEVVVVGEAPSLSQGPREPPQEAPQPPPLMSFARAADPKVSPPKPQPVCSFCSGFHMVWQCQKLASVPVGDRPRELMCKNLCFQCLQLGHRKDTCPTPPVCMQCKEPHNTVFHGYRPPSGRPPCPPTPQAVAPEVASSDGAVL